jgi:5-methylcytosine-specific restriction endonuclease McrA
VTCPGGYNRRQEMDPPDAHSQSKRCRACRRDLPGTAYSPDRRSPDGLQGRCRDCYNGARNARRVANPEPDRARDRQRYWGSPGRRDAVIAAARRARERDPAAAKLQSRRWHADHREEVLAKQRQHYSENVEAERAAARQRSKRRTPEQRSVYVHVRRARHRGAFVERVDRSLVFERDAWICQLCGLPVDASIAGQWDPQRASLDHIIPLFRGGEHSYANTRLAHLGCNLRRPRLP